MTTRLWTDVVPLHDRAVAAYAAAARRVAGRADVWRAPIAPRKWSPAEITQHLVLAFEAVLREVDDGVSMALRTTTWQRLLLRFTIQRRLLVDGIFPGGARSPRETRPDDVDDDAATLIERFEALADQLRDRVDAALAAQPALRLTHPYFGRLPVVDIIFISARHIDHHRGQLPVTGDRAAAARAGDPSATPPRSA